jgi:dihydrofolate synthase/folylpolyglutamate synthase
MSAVLREFARRPKFGTGPGLLRSQRLLEILEITPQSTIGITGSNGKGSTAAMAAGLLSAAGLRTGLYTSPHFLDPTERFRIDGVPVALGTLESALLQVSNAADKITFATKEQFSRFELLTAAAWLIFRHEKVDALVMEVGIGGRYCPTKLGKPAVTALTSLDFEHTEILGNTLELIACDKVELTPPGGVCFASLPHDPLLRATLYAHAAAHRISLVTLQEAWPELSYQCSEVPSLAGVTAQGTTLAVTLPLLGPWQANNAALAISCAQAALESRGRAISPLTTQSWAERGFAHVQVPGRFEKVHESPAVIVDSAHTPDALAQVVRYIGQRYPGGGVVLCGISASKPVAEMARVLAALPFDFFVSASSHGGAMPEIVNRLLTERGVAVRKCSSDLSSILPQAMALAAEKGVPLFVLGGLFFAADVCRILPGASPSEGVYL